MKIAPALLEMWMRDYYFSTEIDIGSSGVENFSLGDLRKILGLAQKELDDLIFRDSQSTGGADLREAIAKRYGGGAPNCVMVTHGSSEGQYLILNTLLRRGDEVVVLEPIYQALRSIAESIGCRLKPWKLRYERKFAPDLEEVKKLIGSDTRMVIVNFPHNPTGTSLTMDEYLELLGIIRKSGAYLLWDGAFTELTYEQPPLPDPRLLYERSISLGTLSKAYGLPGLRVGWCLASPEVIGRCVELRDYVTLHLSPLVELLALKVVEKADRLLNMRREQARQNIEILTEWIRRHSEVISWVRPKGGVCAFPYIRGVKDIEEFCRRFANQYRTLLVPGSCFRSPGFVRLGFGGATYELIEGLSRLSSMMRASGMLIP
jgi:capreomycidine synthase